MSTAQKSTSLNTVIFGASSAISQACAQLWASQEQNLCLVARDNQKLTVVAQDLKVRYPSIQIHTVCADLEQWQTHSELIDSIVKDCGSIDRALLCYGVLGNEEHTQNNFSESMPIFSSNFISQASLCIELSKKLKGGPQSGIYVVSSVAGDRGRASNFIYGSAKAGLIAFVSGLRAKLFQRPQPIHVMDIRPGFVISPMTAHLKRKGPLWATPERIAISIDRGIQKQKSVVYAPWFWCWIMLIIKLIPQPIFKRLKL